MLVVRAPFRASLLGGGTDIPWFFEANGGGAVISGAINKYIYLSIHPLFDSSDILLKYSRIERVAQARSLEHPIARAVLSEMGISGLDISVSADVPAGTGLGSSSAFTVGLIHLLNAYSNQEISKKDLASEACRIEIEVLREPIGKQDQFASAYGGLNLITFGQDGGVRVAPINVDAQSLEWLSSSLLLVRVGAESRSASEVLSYQRKYSFDSESAILGLNELRDLTLESVSEIERDIRFLGRGLQLGWELKKKSHPHANMSEVDTLIEDGIRQGALGAKLLGAGGGGFVLFLVEKEIIPKLIEKFKPLATMVVGLDSSGSKLVYKD
jgi:D-glycero-alpha-D-manno-heptose-7-phosphate kinase